MFTGCVYNSENTHSHIHTLGEGVRVEAGRGLSVWRAHGYLQLQLNSEFYHYNF